MRVGRREMKFFVSWKIFYSSTWSSWEFGDLLLGDNEIVSEGEFFLIRQDDSDIAVGVKKVMELG